MLTSHQSNDIHLRVILKRVLQLLFCIMNLKIVISCNSFLAGINELQAGMSIMFYPLPYRISSKTRQWYNGCKNSGVVYFCRPEILQSYQYLIMVSWHGNTFILVALHDDCIKWKHFPRYWPFVRGIHRSPVTSSHKGQWRGALMFSLICVWINGWVNNREAGDLRRYRAHYDVTLMLWDEWRSHRIHLTEDR